LASALKDILWSQGHCFFNYSALTVCFGTYKLPVTAGRHQLPIRLAVETEGISGSYRVERLYTDSPRIPRSQDAAAAHYIYLNAFLM